MRPKGFGAIDLQRRAEPALLAVLRKWNIPQVDFQSGDGRPPVRYVVFEFNGKRYELVISDNITMTEGERLFECYERRELATDEALVACFAQRLDQFLSGEAWDA